MKKIRENVILFIIILIIIAPIILIRPLGDLDEIWNYNFAKNIAEGKIPYKDFNMVITPLVSILSAFALSIFANELLVMRFLAILVATSILYMSYKVLRKLNLDVERGIICTFVIGCVFRNYFCLDYNFVILLITLTIIYLELRKMRQEDAIYVYDMKLDFSLGFLAGLAICCKQTTGGLLALTVILYKCLIMTNLKRVKLFLKIAGTRFMGMIIPVIIMFMYFLVTGSFEQFIDYTFLGIKTFSNSIPVTYLIQYGTIPAKFFAIVLPITAIYMFYVTIAKTPNNHYKRKLFIMLVYGIISLSVALPITDTIHFLIGALPLILAFMYIIYGNVKKFFMEREKQKSILPFFNTFYSTIITTITILLILFSVKNIINYQNQCDKGVKHFRYIINEHQQAIETIDDYIIKKKKENKNVYILDASAALYMIPINVYNKDYDMFMKGNFGGEGEDGLINRINNEENAIYLLLNDNYQRNWQNPDKVRGYILDNYTKTGTILQFDIYE